MGQRHCEQDDINNAADGCEGGLLTAKAVSSRFGNGGWPRHILPRPAKARDIYKLTQAVSNWQSSLLVILWQSSFNFAQASNHRILSTHIVESSTSGVCLVAAGSMAWLVLLLLLVVSYPQRLPQLAPARRLSARIAALFLETHC
ncbi:hypothetical protein CISG_00862 [Coccidioides immitis RMSCC 3703]|uniref:Uncharacterized protein n=2 Tax=Coccidioides immitis TaxID=5501 RepID=A0A0J8QUI5_COCIT|nr:hypothetical protein CIRG_03654 [Coccidioides immitis RMSCC 2394]KMU74933.1 hypothetical protein CISG_00862 [Coccidioides immitis RMSCC 3703]